MIEDDVLGFLKAGRYRKLILNLLSRKISIPREIADELEISLSQVSRTLTELKNYKLVECNTPQRSKGKIYRITETGLKTLKYEGEL